MPPGAENFADADAPQAQLGKVHAGFFRQQLVEAGNFSRRRRPSEGYKQLSSQEYMKSAHDV